MDKISKKEYNFRKSVNIVKEMALIDFRLKYHDSVLGYFWSMLNPIMQFAVLHFVFSYLFVAAIHKFTFYLLSGIIFWNFFYDATVSGIYAVQAKSAISKKIFFPRNLIIFSSTATALISFVINVALLWLIIIIFDHFSFHQFLIFIPFTAIIFFTMGITFILAVLYIYFRDTIQIWLVCLNVGFWLTPIVYNALTAPLPLKMVALFNPLGRMLVLVRSSFVYGDFPPVDYIISTAVISFLIFVFGYWLFNRHSYQITEYL